nr:hypothetical protein Iba_chr01bCG3840 [Ipomoea batatas]
MHQRCLSPSRNIVPATIAVGVTDDELFIAFSKSDITASNAPTEKMTPHQKLQMKMQSREDNVLGGGAQPVIFQREEAAKKETTDGVGLSSSVVGLGVPASSSVSQLEDVTLSVQVGSEVVLFQWLETGTKVSS